MLSVLSFRRQRQGHVSEFRAILVLIESSRTDRATLRETGSKENKKKRRQDINGTECQLG